ncbi:MAG: glycerate kinase [Halioglobus sp.]|nr:glycerate kinase [Halioglobus sp.]
MRASPADADQFLRELFEVMVAAANPHQVLARHLPDDTRRPAVVIGAGKAAAAMAASLETHWQGELSGLVVTRYGHGEPCKLIEVVEAAHPVPDDQGEAVARRMLQSVSGLGADDLVICLLSGGGSSLLALPAPGLTLADKQAVNRQLLRSGAPIDAMNCVRKHLSSIKGGRLALACQPARVLTLAISDVPGDDLAVIASGPTVADPSSSAQALEILATHGIDANPRVLAWLRDERAETPKPGDPAFAANDSRLVATPASALQAAAAAARDAGLEVMDLGAEVEGEAREVAAAQADMALAYAREGRRCLILSGGETTVTVRGSGRGGRNAEFLLALANELRGAAGIHALAADTDGIDGSEDNAGALLRPESWTRATAQGLDARAMLDNNDGYGFFHALGDLVITGPTRTNVNDFRAVLVLP